MTKPTEQLIDEIVRDLTSVDYMVRAKSETRRRLEELVATARKEKKEKKEIIDKAVAEAWNDGFTECERIDLPQAVAEAIERTREKDLAAIKSLELEYGGEIDDDTFNLDEIQKKDQYNEGVIDAIKLLSSLRDKHLKD